MFKFIKTVSQFETPSSIDIVQRENILFFDVFFHSVKVRIDV